MSILWKEESCGCNPEKETVCQNHHEQFQKLLDEEWAKMAKPRMPWGLIAATMFWQLILSTLLGVVAGGWGVLASIAIFGLTVCSAQLVRRLK